VVPERRRARNLRVAAGLTGAGWADAFLTACREKKLPGFDVPSETILLSEIDFLYRESAEAVRTCMKDGAAKAVTEYAARGYDSGVLRGLAAIASITRASAAVPDLASYVIAMHSQLGRDGTPEFRLAVDLISALGTFPRHPRVASLFRTLFFDDQSVHFRFSGMMVVAVVRADPEAFVPAMNRFYERRSRGPQYFHDRTLMNALFKAVLPSDLERMLDLLHQPARRYVVDWADKLGVLRNIFPPDDEIYDADGPAPHSGVQNYDALKDLYQVTALRRGRVEDLQDEVRKELDQ
jgi:hypothetical protein